MSDCWVTSVCSQRLFPGVEINFSRQISSQYWHKTTHSTSSAGIPWERCIRTSSNRSMAFWHLFNNSCVPPNKWRLIKDITYLNKFLLKKSFKVDTIRSIINILQLQDFIAKIDRRDAYLHVPTLPSHRRFLRIAVSCQGTAQHFQFACLPSGISVAPRVFTKLIVVLTATLRLEGICVVPHLDDWFICASSKQNLTSHIETSLELLQLHGFLIKKKHHQSFSRIPNRFHLYKSEMIPKTDLQDQGQCGASPSQS